MTRPVIACHEHSNLGTKLAVIRYNSDARIDDLYGD